MILPIRYVAGLTTIAEQGMDRFKKTGQDLVILCTGYEHKQVGSFGTYAWYPMPCSQTTIVSPAIAALAK